MLNARGPAGDERSALVLVVEDNLEMSQLIAETLTGVYRVVTAFNGREGLRQAIALQPDLIVSDTILPDMGADELVRAIRTQRALELTPIVVLTAKADDQLAVRLLHSGVQDYLTKPFSVAELRIRVDNLVERRRAEEQSRELGALLQAVASASTVIADAVAAMPGVSINAVLEAIASEAQALTRAQYVAVGCGIDPERSFEPWVFVGLSAEEAATLGPYPRPVGALGVIARGDQTVRMRDVRQHPAFAGFPPGHPQMTSFLGVPIRYRGASMGDIYLTNKRGAEEFTERDQRLTEMLAAHAAVAIATARVHQLEWLSHRQTEATLQTRAEVIGSITHDLKHPLTIIHAQAELLLRDVRRLSPTVQALFEPGLRRITIHATQTAALIDELDDAARLEGGRRLHLNRAPVDLVGLVRKIVEEHGYVFEDHVFEFTTRVPYLCGEWDPARLQRVLANVLSNALKYSQAEGAIAVSVVQEEDSAGSWGVVRVRDWGVGVPRAELPRIFERFHRAANARGKVPGTGLGLAGARRIVQQHGGTLTLDSQQGAGTTVSMRLPLAASRGLVDDVCTR